MKELKPINFKKISKRTARSWIRRSRSKFETWILKYWLVVVAVFAAIFRANKAFNHQEKTGRALTKIQDIIDPEITNELTKQEICINAFKKNDKIKVRWEI